MEKVLTRAGWWLASSLVARLAMAGTAALLIAGSIALSACASKAPQQLPPEPGTPTTTSSDNGAPIPGSQADFVAFSRGADVANRCPEPLCRLQGAHEELRPGE